MELLSSRDYKDNGRNYFFAFDDRSGTTTGTIRWSVVWVPLPNMGLREGYPITPNHCLAN